MHIDVHIDMGIKASSYPHAHVILAHGTRANLIRVTRLIRLVLPLEISMLGQMLLPNSLELIWMSKLYTLASCTQCTWPGTVSVRVTSFIDLPLPRVTLVTKI